MKKVVNWILIILGALLIVALGIFGSGIYLAIHMIAKGLGIIIVMGVIIWFVVTINKERYGTK